MYQDAVRRLFHHFESSQVRNIASLLSKALNYKTQVVATGCEYRNATVLCRLRTAHNCTIRPRSGLQRNRPVVPYDHSSESESLGFSELQNLTQIIRMIRLI
jgi:hypothetical protein